MCRRPTRPNPGFCLSRVASRSSRRPRPRAARGEGDRLRDEILAATERLLLETGDENAVSVRAIALAVGVTPPSIYLHFTDKESLIVAVCQRQFDRLDVEIAAVLAGVDDPMEALRCRGRAYIEFGIAHPEHYRILMMGRRELTVEDLEAGTLPGARSLLSLVENVSACMEQGSLARADPMLVACGLWVLVHGLTSLSITVPGFPIFVELDALVDHVFDTTERGLRP